MRSLDPHLLDVVRTLVPAVLSRGAVTRIEPLQVRRDAAVLRVTVVGGPRLIVKVVDPQAKHLVEFERTAMLTALARAAGVPVPEILAADDSCQDGRWPYLVAEHLQGIPWRYIRPHLNPIQVAAAHQQLAVALIAVQSIRFPWFGELDRSGQPPAGQNILAALHRRADSRIRDESARESFHLLLDRDAALFATQGDATLCHDDLHHHNVLFRRHQDGLRLAGLLDWDKAWAGPAESDVARMTFWDDMTGPGFWGIYRSHVPASEGEAHRSLIYQLLWCLEYNDRSPRHLADTAGLRHRLAVP